MLNRKRVLIFNGYFIPPKNYGGPLTSCKNVIKTGRTTCCFYSSYSYGKKCQVSN